MTNKKTTYSDDIKESFGDKLPRKKIKELAEDIKSLQAHLAPSSNFKQKLLKRLEGVHTLDELTSTPVSFSFFRAFGTVFSFVLMFGVAYMIHDMRQINIYDTIHPIQETISNTPAKIETLRSKKQ